MQHIATTDLEHVTGGGPIWEGTKKWGGRAVWAATVGSSAWDGVSDGKADYDKNKSLSSAVYQGGKTFVKEMAIPAAYAAVRYAGLYNPYTLGAAAFAYVMQPTPAY